MMMDSVQTASSAQTTEELTELGKCLMKHEVSQRRIKSLPEKSTLAVVLDTVYQPLFLLFPQNIYMSLLTLSYNSLSWKDTTNCHRTASMICWALLRQVDGAVTAFLRDISF